ncbi:LacI family transcriptional regulator [Alteromonas aestuariivivens]|uniref:LacI family transcriptional regulator n=1 Tax=Alteromonas aestuariivivens TaxID=1938339 RepID=A0A3D8MCH8_9ALTE|nr:LacI family DNA-binding transcriptional regulator [Alteromonas aestuariivivens]RDV27995.1 LacI family transcriptional regulator [Alteromonas aestuariivivens]
MPTIKDIAKAAGVSPASVSRVINNGPKVGKTTREKIKRIIEEMGYSPNANAQAINAHSSASVGLVLANLIDPFYAALAHGIEQVAARRGAQIFLNSCDDTKESERRAIETLLEHRYQSIVVHSLFLEDEELIRLAKSVPGLVLINRYIEALADRCVWFDDEMGGRLMAQHLVKMGHREIAVIAGESGFSSASQRIPAAIKELNRLGVIVHPEVVEVAPANYEGGQVAMQNLLASKKPFTALITYNDPMAIGAIAMLNAQGLAVPGDVSVIGYDNLMLANCIEPKLTTIHHQIGEMAVVATEMALSKIVMPPAIEKRHFKPHLVERDSVVLRA